MYVRVPHLSASGGELKLRRQLRELIGKKEELTLLTQVADGKTRNASEVNGDLEKLEIEERVRAHIHSTALARCMLALLSHLRCVRRR